MANPSRLFSSSISSSIFFFGPDLRGGESRTSTHSQADVMPSIRGQTQARRVLWADLRELVSVIFLAAEEDRAAVGTNPSFRSLNYGGPNK